MSNTCIKLLLTFEIVEQLGYLVDFFLCCGPITFLIKLLVWTSGR